MEHLPERGRGDAMRSLTDDEDKVATAYVMGISKGIIEGRRQASEDLNKLDGWNTGCPCNCGKTKYVLCKEEAIYAARNGVIN